MAVNINGTGSITGLSSISSPTISGGSLPAGTASAPGITFSGDSNTGIYSPGADKVAITTSGTERLIVDDTGNVGIGTTSPGGKLVVSDGSTTFQFDPVGGTGNVLRSLTTGGSRDSLLFDATQYTFTNSATEYARIDSSGRLLVGTSSAIGNGLIQAEATGDSLVHIRRNTNSISSGPALQLRRSYGTSLNSFTAVQDGGNCGYVQFFGSDGSADVIVAQISAAADGQTLASGDNPGRLVFSTTADGASSPTERMRITQDGYARVSNTGSYQGGAIHEFTNNTTSSACLLARATNTSFVDNVIPAGCLRSANSAYRIFAGYSGNGSTNSFSDLEFNLRGDGNAYADGSWNGGGADYAEYFEWSDSNPDEEDRRGISVVLDGEKIRPAVDGEDPIGVISGNPSVVGDSAWNKWNGKYLRDEFGTYIQEDYEVEDEDGNTVIQQRRKLNPAYDPDVEYISREERPEWDCVGLMGKLRIRKGQPTGSRWIKMRDISDSVEEWLVR